MRYINEFPNTLSDNEYKHLKQFPFCVEFTRKIKQNDAYKKQIPYCKETFDRFINSYYVEKLYLHNTYVKSNESYFVLRMYHKNKMDKSQTQKYCVTFIEYEILHDDEFAWACFYDLDVFQKFPLFIDYKNSYLLRKERLLVVHEEFYKNYEHSDAINMVFANDFLVRTIMRFL